MPEIKLFRAAQGIIPVEEQKTVIEYGALDDYAVVKSTINMEHDKWLRVARSLTTKYHNALLRDNAFGIWVEIPKSRIKVMLNKQKEVSQQNG